MSEPTDDGALEDRLRALDDEINRTRQRLYMVRYGLAHVPDPDQAISELERRFQELGDEFTEAYRKWNNRS